MHTCSDLNVARERQEMDAYLSQFPQGGSPPVQGTAPAEANGATGTSGESAASD